MKVNLIRSEEGDWIGLYKDGLLVAQNHSLGPSEVLRALGIEHEDVTASMDLFEQWGYGCPIRLPEVAS